jgi:hypothetical protein
MGLPLRSRDLETKITHGFGSLLGQTPMNGVIKVRFANFVLLKVRFANDIRAIVRRGVPVGRDTTLGHDFLDFEKKVDQDLVPEALLAAEITWLARYSALGCPTHPINIK